METDADTTTKKEESSTSPPEAEVKPEPAENTEEKEAVDDEQAAKQKLQLNQRELFLSKQVEILPATNIRGKCSVTLLNETESFSSYLEKEVSAIVYRQSCDVTPSYVLVNLRRMLFSTHWCMTPCSGLSWQIAAKSASAPSIRLNPLLS